MPSVAPKHPVPLFSHPARRRARRTDRPRRAVAVGQRGDLAEQPETATAETSAGGDRSARYKILYRLQWAMLSVIGLMVAVQPVGADDLWWQLSRGRAVWEGSLTPSATLLTLESRAEADWLGGLPAYALYQVLDFHGWMLWRVAVVAAILVAAVRAGRTPRLLSPLSLLLVSITLVAFADGFNPLPRLFNWEPVGVEATEEEEALMESEEYIEGEEGT